MHTNEPKKMDEPELVHLNFKILNDCPPSAGNRELTLGNSLCHFIVESKRSNVTRD